MDSLDRLRALCLSYPETSERLSHGEPTWFRKKRVFVMYSDHHHGGPLAFWCPAAEGVQQALIAAEPDRFYKPPYVGVKGWIGVILDDPDWDVITELVDNAYQFVAKK